MLKRGRNCLYPDWQAPSSKPHTHTHTHTRTRVRTHHLLCLTHPAVSQINIMILLSIALCLINYLTTFTTWFSCRHKLSNDRTQENLLDGICEMLKRSLSQMMQAVMITKENASGISLRANHTQNIFFDISWKTLLLEPLTWSWMWDGPSTNTLDFNWEMTLSGNIPHDANSEMIPTQIPHFTRWNNPSGQTSHNTLTVR